MGDYAGTMTPITGGAPGGSLAAQPLPYTLLSLHRFAKMLGIAPLHFASAIAANLNPAVFPIVGTCGDIWARHDWQKADQVSHESLLYAIQEAEQDIAKIVGYYPAPTWISQEQHMFPREFYPEAWHSVLDARGFRKGMTLDFGRLIAGGRRAVELIDSATVAGGSLAYTDEDGDGFFETATITLAGVTLTNANEAKVYFTGMSGEREWEIRPVRSKSLSAGTLTIIMDSWLFIDPELLAAFPTDDGFSAIDVSTVANFVNTVDVYREYNDTTEVSSILYWESVVGGTCTCNGLGCPACADTTQDGCLQIRNPNQGIAVPIPASYDSTDARWETTTYSVARAPDRVAFWYYAGDIDSEYHAGRSYDPLSNHWAWIITWVAIARLERPPCSCERLANYFDYLRRDLSESTSASSFFTPQEIHRNPLGTHRGEIMAWRKIRNFIPKKPRVAMIK